MANVVGLTHATAEGVLNGILGFGVQVSFVNAGPTKKGIVVSQTPAGGEATKGSTVTIVVGL